MIKPDYHITATISSYGEKLNDVKIETHKNTSIRDKYWINNIVDDFNKKNINNASKILQMENFKAEIDNGADHINTYMTTGTSTTYNTTQYGLGVVNSTVTQGNSSYSVPVTYSYTDYKRVVSFSLYDKDIEKYNLLLKSVGSNDNIDLVINDFLNMISVHLNSSKKESNFTSNYYLECVDKELTKEDILNGKYDDYKNSIQIPSIKGKTCFVQDSPIIHNPKKTCLGFGWTFSILTLIPWVALCY